MNNSIDENNFVGLDQYLSDYRELLVKNQVLNKTGKNTPEQKRLQVALQEVERNLTSKEIIV